MRRTGRTILIVVALLLPTILCGNTPAQTPELETLRQAAERGDAEAQFNLGVMYANGRGVPQNHHEAVQWYRRAAEQGLAKAQFYLGAGYVLGNGVQQDDHEAVQWFRRAAEQDHAAAQRILGMMYANGKGVPQDDREAMHWYRRAAKQGLAEAQYNLGLMYANGQGVPQDHHEAVHWYRRAAKQGLAKAQYNLGVMYANGEGVPQDDREAVQWFHRAAEQGLAKAQFNLGVMYANGRGVPQDNREAVHWYRRAAEQGDAKAQGNLGLMYATGEGVIQDDREAYIWFLLAAVNGAKDSTEFRDRLAKRLSPSKRLASQTEAKRRLQAIDARLADRANKKDQYAKIPVPLTPVAPPAPRRSPAQRAFEHGWRSVVVLTTSNAQGSGVIIRPNVVATNCHVVEDGADIAVYKAENRRARTDAPHSARLRHANKERDLCLLDVSELWGVSAQLRGAKSLSIGEAVYAIGAPRGLDYSLSAGVVSQLRTDASDAPVIQTDAAVSPGSSGGGLFDASGNLVGITTQKISDGEITFAIPTEWILEIR